MITKKRIDRAEKPLYYVIIASIILYFLQRIFIPVTILNSPLRLILCVVLLLILLSIFITRNRLLFLGQSPNDEPKTRALVIAFNAFKYFVAFGMIYYFNIQLLFTIYVRFADNLGPQEKYTIAITQINKASSKGSPSIGFYFKDKYNTLSGNQFYALLKNTQDRFNPKRNLKLTCKQSLFNSYLVESYYLE